jgi:hypothetical protein
VADDTGTQYAGLAPMERAAASADFHMRTCDAPTIAECEQCQRRLDRIQTYLAVLLPAHRAQVLDEAADRARQLNGPMVARLRRCAADTSPNWDGAVTVYPPESRDLVALIDYLLAATGPTATPETRQEPDGGPAVPVDAPGAQRPTEGVRLRDSEAERDRLADTVRRYQPVINAAKAWADPDASWAGDVRDTPQDLALVQAVDALDASPGDAETGQRDEEPK